MCPGVINFPEGATRVVQLRPALLPSVIGRPHKPASKPTIQVFRRLSNCLPVVCLTDRPIARSAPATFESHTPPAPAHPARFEPALRRHPRRPTRQTEHRSARFAAGFLRQLPTVQRNDIDPQEGLK